MAEDTHSILGRGWGFPPTFDKAGATVRLVDEEEDVRQSLEILLSTRIGERLMQPRFGCNLDRFQFEPLDTTVRTYIKELVRDAILYFEPRVILESVTLTTVPDEGLLNIEVWYRIPATNSRNNLVYPFYIDEASNPAP